MIMSNQHRFSSSSRLVGGCSHLGNGTNRVNIQRFCRWRNAGNVFHTKAATIESEEIPNIRCEAFFVYSSSSCWYSLFMFISRSQDNFLNVSQIIADPEATNLFFSTDDNGFWAGTLIRIKREVNNRRIKLKIYNG